MERPCWITFVVNQYGDRKYPGAYDFFIAGFGATDTEVDASLERMNVRSFKSAVSGTSNLTKQRVK